MDLDSPPLNGPGLPKGCPVDEALKLPPEVPNIEEDWVVACWPDWTI